MYFRVSAVIIPSRVLHKRMIAIAAQAAYISQHIIRYI
ncbi:hypothetical protein APHWI1_1239 [Anaplasma phagocytophilum str. ApWI1]|uniref:Uncharacterized protein n=2 Tax=Anaplasma phagocytophilum TaxID=948 RepID=A0A0F3NJG7_ANAPH|nr:hypothetical protein APHWEB_0280 [Anaplasma phagocytophilum str. Webster]KJV68160.1 hypothetical protein EPHNCH_0453 [Anaplasma phagocytophilum str. NCH-1]KJV83276.1 hypothetical protein APHHGE2_0466 [Anaplasma phagocytophilum str. HGE2]KJV84360.1 hypothetical protein APHWI1_1239 [Anaplasma phagocytophilum str. ApWI1]KJV99408.1 hypothetical protein OTSANNIE_0437 [Anaplasma phagocytophilum str. Annie]